MRKKKWTALTGIFVVCIIFLQYGCGEDGVKDSPVEAAAEGAVDGFVNGFLGDTGSEDISQESGDYESAGEGGAWDSGENDGSGDDVNETSDSGESFGPAAAAREKTAKEAEEDWFEKWELKTTSPKVFTFNTTYGDNDGDLGEISPDCKGKIYIKTDGAPEGYKNVVFYFEFDYAEYNLSDGQGVRYWYTAFDRSSGLCFEVNDDYPDKDENGLVTIDNGNRTFKAAVKFEYGKKDGHIRQSRATVTVPADYDDTMFQLGYSNKAYYDENAKVDMSSRLYRLDELPCFDTNGHEYLYFDTSEATVEDSASSGTSSDTGNSDKGAGGVQEGSDGKKTTDEILELAKKKSGAPKAILEDVEQDGTLDIRLTGESGNTQDTWDWYYIDPVTLKGTNLLGEPVDLNN